MDGSLGTVPRNLANPNLELGYTELTPPAPADVQSMLVQKAKKYYENEQLNKKIFWA